MKKNKKTASYISKSILYCFLMLIISGCIGNGKVSITTKNSKVATLPLTVSSIKIADHQVVISGVSLSGITQLEVIEGATHTNLQIDSQTSSSIVANTLANFTFDAGKVFSFILSNASGSASYTVDFSLCHSLLGGKAIDCLTVPNDKEILSYDALSGKWKPRSVNGLSYKGTWNATGAAPSATTVGDYYIVSVAGSGYAVGDWTVYRGSGVFDRIGNSTAITSVFGRTGAIVATKNDYSLNKMSDVSITGTPGTGEVLTFDGTNWVSAPLPPGPGGTVKNVSGTGPISVTNPTVNPVITIAQATSSVDGYLSSANWTTFNNKQNNIVATTSADYYRGDKTFQPLTTTAVTEGTNYYFTNARVLSTPLALLDVTLTGPIVATDTVLEAFGKTQKQLTAISSSGATYLIKNSSDTLSGAVSLTNVITASGTGDVITRDVPLGLTSAVNKNYADGKLDKTAGGTLSGVLTLDNDLKIKGGSNYVTIKVMRALLLIIYFFLQQQELVVMFYRQMEVVIRAGLLSLLSVLLTV